MLAADITTSTRRNDLKAIRTMCASSEASNEKKYKTNILNYDEFPKAKATTKLKKRIIWCICVLNGKQCEENNWWPKFGMKKIRAEEQQQYTVSRGKWKRFCDIVHVTKPHSLGQQNGERKTYITPRNNKENP